MRQHSDSRSYITVYLVLTIAACALSKWVTSGWFATFGCVLYPLVILTHILVQIKLITSNERLPRRAVVAAGVSNTLLLFAFLLQYDADDSSGWLTITYLLSMVGVGTKESETLLRVGEFKRVGLNLIVFVPVALSWVVVATLDTTERAITLKGVCRKCGYRSNVSGRCPECGTDA